MESLDIGICKIEISLTKDEIQLKEFLTSKSFDTVYFFNNY